MPLKLILTRHAKSSWKDPLQSDHDRPLNNRGRQSARAIGNWLHSNGHLPNQILCSSARRTEETAKLMGFDVPTDLNRALYHAGASVMLGELKHASGHTVLMLGHNPGIGDFAERLAQNLPRHVRFLDYPTCATTVFEFDCQNWSDIELGTGKVSAFVVPRELLE